MRGAQEFPLQCDGTELGFGLVLQEAAASAASAADVALATAHLTGLALGRSAAFEAVQQIEARYRATEDALRGSEERFRFALRGANDGIWDWNLRTNAIVYSTRWKSMLGYEDHELVDLVETWQRLLHPADRATAEERLRQFFADGAEKYENEFRMVHKDGTYRNILARGQLVLDDDGKPQRMVGTHVDITQRKMNELAIRRSEEMLRRTQGIANVWGWTYDIAEGLLTSSADAFRQTTRAETEAAIASWEAMVHPDDLQAVRDNWKTAITGVPYELEYRMDFGKGTRWIHGRATTEFDAEGKPSIMVGVAQDVTERKELEERLLQAQKMDAIGQLAGGIAHDFNNILTVINGEAELLLEQMPAGTKRDAIAEIRAAGERASTLTHQLLAFSRKQILHPRLVDLNTIVAQSEKMLSRLIGEDITVVTLLDPNLVKVQADLGQIDQLILNLVVNARDAMPTGGRLTLETKNVRIDGHSELPPGLYVELAVTDTGMGIPEQLKTKIFEPFFTTKCVGRGTGLGLATVYGIAKQSGGHVTVESTVGSGTTFRLFLPRATASGAAVEADARFAEPDNGTETILLVEDEPGVRRIARRALETHGYVVLEADCGARAVRMVEAHATPIDLLLTDVVMPGMNGRQLADLLNERGPEVPVLFMSGYTDDAVVRNGVLEAEDNVLSKPFTPMSLIRKVRGVLDATAPR